jgi:hypothetical protein
MLASHTVPLTHKKDGVESIPFLDDGLVRTNLVDLSAGDSSEKDIFVFVGEEW